MNTICMYTPSADGGMAQYAQELMKALAEHPGAEHRYELVSGEDLQEQFRTDQYVIHAILPSLLHRSAFSTRASWATSRILHYPRREWRFLKWLRGRPEIVGVHLQEWTPWLAARLLRRIRAMGKKTFYTVHNVVPHKYPALVPRKMMDGWVRRASRLCDGLFVHTEQLAETLAQFLGEGHPPIQVVPHGVWTVRDAVPAPSIERRLAMKRLLFFGTIRRNKGLHVLLRAADDLPGYAITIAGEPHEPEYFRDEILPQVRRLQKAGMRIDLLDRFIGDNELGALFATHSAIVMPYTRGFVAQSGVVFLALAYELPVVASEAGGLGDLLADFRIGRTFRDATPAAVAGAVKALHADGAGLDLIAQIRAAKRRFSWREAAAATITGYSTVLGTTETHSESYDCAVQTTSAR